MPILERLLALRLGWIVIRLGVVVSLALSFATPAASAIWSDNSDTGLEEGEILAEGSLEAELQEQLAILPPLFGHTVLIGSYRRALACMSDEGPARRYSLPSNARAPPLV
ncbi:MAG TPA: hypothetical protein ENK31_02045 [Nannocystis exedens]|nr:hypothetical protein [Nannocystis exedens]